MKKVDILLEVIEAIVERINAMEVSIDICLKQLELQSEDIELLFDTKKDRK